MSASELAFMINAMASSVSFATIGTQIMFIHFSVIVSSILWPKCRPASSTYPRTSSPGLSWTTEIASPFSPTMRIVSAFWQMVEEEPFGPMASINSRGRRSIFTRPTTRGMVLPSALTPVIS